VEKQYEIVGGKIVRFCRVCFWHATKERLP